MREVLIILALAVGWLATAALFVIGVSLLGVPVWGMVFIVFIVSVVLVYITKCNIYDYDDDGVVMPLVSGCLFLLSSISLIVLIVIDFSAGGSMIGFTAVTVGMFGLFVVVELPEDDNLKGY